MSNQIRNVFGDLWNGEWSCGGRPWKNRTQPTGRATTSPSQSLQIFPRGKRILIELVAYAAPLRHIVVKDLDETLIMARRYQVGEATQGVTYPRLLKAAGACPPEDVGGAWGYEEFLEALADPD
ncbi:MAG: hypothetical protein VXW58_11835, partial [Pseudomonadota bacterium]|nr:hypothetical protein [Pseudomonadota bacterium]